MLLSCCSCLCFGHHQRRDLRDPLIEALKQLLQRLENCVVWARGGNNTEDAIAVAVLEI
jgi:hypothetical protein